MDEIVERHLTADQLKEFNRIYYGREDHHEIEVKESTITTSRANNFDVKAYEFLAEKEELREPRIVKLGLIQHSIVLPTDASIRDQRTAIFGKVENILKVAASEGVNIVCLQETWSMPFFLCTRETERWCDFAESASNGPSTIFLTKLANKYDMVIVSPILEVDEQGTWWNTAVIIDADGKVLGKHRKNHLPSVSSYNETTYYKPGDTGHPVFATKYGKIAVNICYGRHHGMNWLMFALNGAEIVFNPAATVAKFGMSFWGIEARNAAIANNYYTCSINRVGEEIFRTEDNKEVVRSYYGSSYVSAPNGCRTPSLGTDKDGLLIAEVDLNLCRQIKDQWGFQMTARLDLYAKELSQKSYDDNH